MRGSGTIPGLTDPVRVATASIEHEAEVLSERFDRIRVVCVRISVRTPDDHGTEGSLVVPRGWEHRRDEGIPLAITQCEKDRHDALDVRLQSDISLNERSRGRHIGCRSTLLRLGEMLLDGVTHRL
jgi:hypothetical protein